MKNKKGDRRWFVVAVVHAKAAFFMRFPEFGRFYGMNASTKLVRGTVLDVVRLCVNGRRRTLIRDQWEQPGISVVHVLPLCGAHTGALLVAPRSFLGWNPSTPCGPMKGSPVTQTSQPCGFGAGGEGAYLVSCDSATRDSPEAHATHYPDGMGGSSAAIPPPPVLCSTPGAG